MAIRLLSGLNVDTGTLVVDEVNNVVGIGTATPASQLSGTIGLSIVNANNAALGLSNGTNNWLNYLSGTTYRIWNNTSNEVVTILLNGNVGIGTTNPSGLWSGTNRTLQIQSASNTSNELRQSRDAGVVGAASITRFLSGTSNLFGVYTADALDYAIYTNDAERMRITAGGNVGIGTTAPSYKLHVEGSTYVSSTLRLIGNMTVGGDTSQWQLAGVANGGAIWQKSHSGAGGSDDRYLRLGNIDNNGVPNYVVSIHENNVGIGTTSPGYKLHVAGNGAFTGIAVTNPDTSGTFNRSSIDVSSNQITMGITAWGQGSVRAGTAWVQTVNNYPLVFGTNDNEVMRLLTNGNVGIGTTSPDASSKVTISSTNQFGLNLENTGTGGVSWQLGATNDSYAAGGGKFVLTYGGLSTQSVFTAVQSTGNIGIGTTSPGFRLDVAGAVSDWAARFYSNASASAYFANGGGYGGYIDAGSNASSSTYLLQLISNGSSRVYVRGDGNVGIGTTAPGQKLEVNGTIVAGTYNNTRAEITSNGRVQEFYSTETNPRWVVSRDLVGGGQAGIGFNDTTGTIDATGSAIGGSLLRALGFYTSNGTSLVERMRIADGGNVGIGTTSPGTKLEVYSIIRVTESASGGILQLEANAGVVSVTSTFYGGTYKPMTFLNGGSERIRLNASGNLSIGNTNDTYKLDVTGAGRFTDTLTASSTAGGTSAIFQNTGAQNSNGIELRGGTAGTSVNWKIEKDNTVGNAFQITPSTANGGTTYTTPSLTIASTGAATFSSSVTASSLIKSGGTSSQYLMADGSVSTLTNPVTGTGTTNYVPKWTSGSAIGNSQIFDNGTNVGIGTASPVSLLNLNNGDAWINVVDTLRGLQFGYAGPSHGSYRAAVMGGAESYGGTDSGMLTFHTQNGYVVSAIPPERMRITSAGNVGIGTTAPYSKLQVNGNITANYTDAIYLDYDLAPDAYAKGFSGRNQSTTVARGLHIFAYDNDSAQGINFWTGTKASPLHTAVITNAGNVGIGATTFGTAKLVVNGNLGLSGTSGAVYGPYFPETGDHTGSLTMQAGFGSAAAGGAITLFGHLNTTKPGWVTIGISQSAGTGATEGRFTVNSSATAGGTDVFTVLRTGNVGIGTTSPGNKLTVSGGSIQLVTPGAKINFDNDLRYILPVTSGDLLRIAQNSFANGIEIGFDNGTAFTSALTFASSGAATFSNNVTAVNLFLTDVGGGAINNNNGNLFLQTSAGTGWIFRNGAPGYAEYMRLGAGGNLLIGTTTDAGYKLDVNGTGRFTDALRAARAIINDGANSTDGIKIVGSLTSSAFTSGIEFIRTTVSGGSKIQPLRDIAIGGVGFNFLVTANNTDEINATYTTAAVITNAGRVGIGTTTPASPLQVSAASVLSQGTLSIVNTYASGGVYFPTARFIQQRGDHSFGIVSEFYTGATSGTDRPSILFNTGNSSNSWQVGMVTSGWGGNDSFGIGYRASNDPASFNTWPTARFLITTGGNVLINTTTDNGSTLRVNGTIYADSTITSATSVRAVEGYFNPYTSAGNIATPVYQDAIFLGPLDNDCTIQFGNEFQSTHGSYIRFRTNSPSAQNTPVNVMTMFPNGKVALNQYGAGTFTSGTVAYNLGVDSAGNIMELPGGVVDGSGTANYVTKWQDANTVTNSQIVDNGTNVGINNTSPKTKLDVNGTIGFGSKTMSMTDTFAAALTLNMNDHTGCYVKITAFGDWGNHSTIAYLGEFFVQASAGGYNEPGIIIRQVDNTGGGDDIQARILDPAGAGTRDFIIELKATSSANTPFTAHIQYEVRGQYNSVS